LQELKLFFLMIPLLVLVFASILVMVFKIAEWIKRVFGGVFIRNTA